MRITQNNLEEEFLFFASGNYHLYGSIHAPGKDNVDRQAGFVLCSPFDPEKFKTYRILFNFCRYLATNGFSVLRFDYMGTGDSSGDFEQSDAESRIANTIDAIHLLKAKRKLTKVGLIGCRTGAAWALLAAEKIPGEISKIILWDPVFNLKEYFYNQLRGNLSEQLVLYGKVIENRDKLVEKISKGEIVNVAGYGFSRKFYFSMTEIDLVQNCPNLNLPIKIVVNSAQPITENHEIAEFCQKNAGNDLADTIFRIPNEFSWEISKGYITYPEESFKSILKVIGLTENLHD